jgi:hypothetical protein
LEILGSELTATKPGICRLLAKILAAEAKELQGLGVAIPGPRANSLSN